MSSMIAKIDLFAVVQRHLREHQTKKEEEQKALIEKNKALIEKNKEAFLTIPFFDKAIKDQLVDTMIDHQKAFWYRFARIHKLIFNIEYYACVCIPLFLLLFTSFLMRIVLSIYKVSSFSNDNNISLYHMVIYISVSCLLLFIAISSLTLASILIFYFTKFLLIKTTYIIYPAHFIIDNLIDMLIIMQEKPDSPLSIKNKRKLIRLLEHTAYCFEHDLEHKLPAEDTITKYWRKEQFKRVAAALREEKKGILLPREGARESFIDTITSTFFYFVTDNWGAIKGKEPEKLTLPQWKNSIVTMLVTALKTIFIAALPLVIFFFIIQPILHLTGATFDTLVSILSIFSVSVLASAFDPNFSTHLANAKDIESYFPRVYR